jgi:hypothetical protein
MAQQLSLKDIRLFYKLHPALLWYANEKLKVLAEAFKNPEALRVSGVENVTKIREVLWKNVDLIDKFVQDNPFRFSKKELSVVLSWKHFVRGKFYVIKLSKEHAILLDDNDPAKAYGIKALATSFENFFGDAFPIMIETTLIPFQEHIIYDGLINHFNVSFGSGYRSNLKESFIYTKTRFGIITSLPFVDQSTTESDEEKLKRYLKTRGSRELFQKEITELLEKNKKLTPVYHQLMGSIQSLEIKKALRIRGIVNGYFGVLHGIIVAVGETRPDLENVITKLIPIDSQAYVFRFEIRARK